jgi:TolB-like protein
LIHCNNRWKSSLTVYFETLARMTETDSQAAPAARRERPGWVAIAFIGVCVLTAVILYLGGLRMVHRPSLRPAIAVLPFHAANGDADAERFGAGLAAQLTGALRRAGELRVVDRAPDVVVQGSVEKAADYLLVTARLVRTANRYQLWSHVYQIDRRVDTAALAETIATAVRAELHIRPGRTVVTTVERSDNAYFL